MTKGSLTDLVLANIIPSPDPAAAFHLFNDPESANVWGLRQETPHSDRAEYQRRALLSYKRQGFRAINAYLRKDKLALNKAFVAQRDDGYLLKKDFENAVDEEICDILGAFETSIIDRGIVVWRAFNHVDTAKLLLNPPEGVYRDLGFASTSLIEEKAARMVNHGEPGGVVMKILVPEYANAIYLEEIYGPGTTPGNEYELLLPRGSIFKVFGASTDEDGITHALVKLVPVGSGSG